MSFVLDRVEATGQRGKWVHFDACCVRKSERPEDMQKGKIYVSHLRWPSGQTSGCFHSGRVGSAPRKLSS